MQDSNTETFIISKGKSPVHMGSNINIKRHACFPDCCSPQANLAFHS